MQVKKVVFESVMQWLSFTFCPRVEGRELMGPADVIQHFAVSRLEIRLSTYKYNISTYKYNTGASQSTLTTVCTPV